MTFEHVLIRYLDGDTIPTEDEELMRELTLSPEKRAMFREHLRLRESLLRDAGEALPPAGVRERTLAAMRAASGAQPPGRFFNWRRIAGAAVMLLLGAAGGTLVSYERSTPPATAEPTFVAAPAPAVASQPAPAAISAAAPTAAPAAAPEVRVERVFVPETVRVAQNGTPLPRVLIVHDTVFVPSNIRSLSLPPSVTVERETVYVSPRR